MPPQPLDSELLNYIVSHHLQPGDQLPALADLSQELNINVGKLREQLEVARSMGLVEVRPRTGIRIKEYEFLPALRLSLLYALALNKSDFEAARVAFIEHTRLLRHRNNAAPSPEKVGTRSSTQ